MYTTPFLLGAGQAFPPLPFTTGAFDRLLTANFYGLLRPDERAVFLAEARPISGELIVVDLRSDSDVHEEKRELRTVGSARYSIFRRRFTPQSLRRELGDEVLYEGR
ncbi:hypothetical protein [Streptomyces sp. ISL-21]|uniref:hypothetical protein n=1 Tax=Streptomyces sp. ISL-21 TaxID=2819179 RepID=UPI001BEAF607|nr:hypothetical protein [Streptomyces sp. ISL-21]MBT2408824.1 hypothetical protein [Streptomyces sp. ISL-21]